MRQYWTFVLLIVAVSIILLMFLTGRPFTPKALVGMMQGKPAAEAGTDSSPDETEADAPDRIVTTTPLYEALTSAPQR